MSRRKWQNPASWSRSEEALPLIRAGGNYSGPEVSPETPIGIKSGALGCSFNNVKSQLGGFPFKLCDLSLAVLGLIEFRSLVYVFHPVAEHAVDQSRQLGGHGFDRNGGAELGSESAKLRSQIGVAYP